MLLAIVIHCLSSCASNPVNPPEYRVSVDAQPLASQRPVSDIGQRDGIYIQEGKTEIGVKCKNKPLISLLDDLFYKKRINYTLLADISEYYVTICDGCEPGAQDAVQAEKTETSWTERKQKRFKNLTAFLDYVMRNVTEGQAKTGYQYVGDGVQFYDLQSPAAKPDYFKKVFLFNLTVDEAAAHLSGMFGLTVSQPPMQTAVMPGQMPMPFPSQGMGPQGTSVIIKLPSQNALLVKASKDILDRISQIMFSLDAPASQVMIETKVFEYDNSLERKIGMAISYLKNNVDGNKQDNFNFNTLFGEGISSSAMPTLGFSLLEKLTDTEFKYKLLNTLALYGRNGLVRISAEPRIVQKSGTSAEVRLNTIKYVITSGVNTSDIRPIETGVMLKIKPTILSENKIYLEMEMEQSDFIPNLEKDIVQTTNKNIIKTSVIVNDGELISLGGINAKKSSSFTSGIPYLKDLPILKYVFGSESVGSNEVRIEFMIRPIIKDYMSRNAGLVQDIMDKDILIQSQIK